MNPPTPPPDPRPNFLREFGQTRGYLLGRPVRPTLTPQADAVVFLRSAGRAPDQELYELDLASGRVRLLVRPADLLAGISEEISPEEQARRERQRITDRGFTAFSLSPDGASVLVSFAGRLFLVARSSGAARPLTRVDAAAPIDPRFSPDGKRIAFVRAGNVHVLDLEGTSRGEPRSITAGANEDRFFGLAEFVAQEEMSRFEGFWWAPDSNRLAYTEVDQRAVERFSIADPARPERPPQVFAYPRAGRANARVRLSIATLGPGSPPPVAVDWDRERYPYLARVLWDTPNAPLSILLQTRDQREMALLQVDETSGSTRPLIVETDADWVNLERDLPRRLPDGGILWASEKDGGRALWRHRRDGTAADQLLAGDAGLLAVVHVAVAAPAADGAGAGVAVFVLTGDALVSRLERIDLPPLDGASTRTVILDEPFDRTVQVSRDGSVILESRTGASLLPESRVLLPDGRIVVVPAVALTPPFRVNLQLCTTDGQPGFHAAVIRPRQFEPGRVTRWCCTCTAGRTA